MYDLLPGGWWGLLSSPRDARHVAHPEVELSRGVELKQEVELRQGVELSQGAERKRATTNRPAFDAFCLPLCISLPDHGCV